MSKTKKASHAPAAEAEKPKKHDESRAGTLRRIAKAFREAAVWDNQTIAAMFEAEANLLDPPPKADEPEE
jgi:hypothetical protein